MKKLPVALAAILVTVAVAALYLWSQLNVGREQLTALQTRVADMETAQKKAAEEAAAAARAAAASAAVTPAGPATPGAPQPKARPSADQIKKGIAAGISDMVSRPEVLRAALEEQYPDLVKTLGLSPLEADKFFALLAKQASDTVGSALGMFAGGDSAAQQESMRKIVQSQLAGEKEMSALLGGKYQQWQEYQGTIAARQQVEQLRMMLGNGENALTEAKSKPLIAALGAETARSTRETNNRMAADVRTSKNLLEDQLKYTVEHNQRLVNAASSYLTSAQLDRYRQMLTQQESMVRMMMGASNKPGSAPAQGGVQR